MIFEEAGGKVTDLNGKPIDFTQGRKMSESKFTQHLILCWIIRTDLALDYGLLCAPSAVHAEVLKMIQETLKAYEESQGPIPWSK